MRNMIERERLLEWLFKRRRRRWNGTLLLLVVAAAVSSITAFVPLSLNRPAPHVHKHTSILDTRPFQHTQKHQRRRRFPVHVLQNSANADASSSSSSDGGKQSYRISPEQLQLIKDSADIVSVVESYSLPGFQRHGNNRAKAICPFHNDHNPSMSVDGERGLYKCFACGAGGDVFNFVREYSALKSGGQMTFYQAVRKVADEYCDASVKLDIRSSSTSRMSEEERKALNEKKERILLANAAAAAFYGKCLVTLPAAGVARSHVQERGLSPTTVKAFAMGYAPDAYFKEKREWGKGSLVEHLRNLGFRPTEMIEAGLATRTKGAQWKTTVGRNNNSNATASQDTDELDEDYTTLIDRFRNRLVVPIFDSRGSNVLAFGARILPPEETDTSGYKAPKYINSPDSVVFHKKNVLFGQHYANEAVREMRKTDAAAGESGPDRGSVVVVEGYMDAIALWEAGVHEVVASMGTALTMEQLTHAARTAGTHGGRIVLCLDSDEAGLNAIERLCTGSLLSKTAETYVVEILVATLPNGVKDPGEYIESKSSKSDSGGDQFRKEVIDKAKDWTAWYLDRLLSRYDDAALRGTAGSFADICDRVSDFLSGFPNPAERTKRAHDVAGSLAEIVSGTSDAAEGSNSLRIQLETDLVNMVARKAGARESIERRIESVDGYSPDDTNQKVAKLTRGEGVNQSDASSKLLSGRALRALNRADSSQSTKGKLNGSRKVSRRKAPFDRDDTSGRPGRRGRARIRRSSKKVEEPPPLTPHFNGFDFENPSDADWLNLPREKWKRKKQDLTLGTAMDSERYAKAQAARIGQEHVSGLFLDDLVYFNSNDYHGQQFVTQDAVDAGYSGDAMAREASTFEHGVGTLVRQDAHVLVNDAEEKLLRNIVRYNRARMAMIHSLATSDATGSRDLIKWSQPERAWLFERLVEQSNTIPKEVMIDGRIKELRFHLASLPDTPIGAFGYDASFNSTTAAQTNDRNDRVTLLPMNSLDGSESREDISTADVNGAVDISSSVDEMNVPSDGEDIESWAASYDPSMFDDTDVVVDLEKSVQEQDSATIDVELVPQDKETSVGDESPGCLDLFFASEDDLFAATYDDSVSRELRAELEVQEAHATLLRASMLKRFAAVKSEWLIVGRALAARLEEGDTTASDQTPLEEEALRTPDGLVDIDSISTDDLKEHCDSVAKTLKDVWKRLHHLDVSAKRIGSRLMDYSNADGVEGRLSVAQQEELASMVDDHVDSLPENWKAPERADGGGMDRWHNNRNPTMGWGDDLSLDRVESFEEDMTQIEEDWGEWADDDFVWSPEDHLDSSKLSSAAASSSTPSVLDNYDVEARLEDADESLEEALDRLDSEWVGWDSDDVQVPRTGNDEGFDEVGFASATDDEASSSDTTEPDFDSIFE